MNAMGDGTAHSFVVREGYVCELGDVGTHSLWCEVAGALCYVGLILYIGRGSSLV